jgi:hypothetical protein
VSYETASFRALGLGVLPVQDADEHLLDLVQMIAKGRPVLTTDAVASQFEGRWHLPTADTAEGLAGWIEGWVDGRDVSYFIDAAEKTRQAFSQDHHAMSSYAGNVVQAALGGAAASRKDTS